MVVPAIQHVLDAEAGELWSQTGLHSERTCHKREKKMKQKTQANNNNHSNNNKKRVSPLLSVSI